MLDIKPHLFISHATRRAGANPKVVEAVDKLYESLAPDWNVFVDKKCLPGGTKWRPKILHTLSTSQAGIILFDKKAIKESDWVKAEALILSFRKSIDPKFQLIPVLFDDLTLDNTCFQAYEPVQLNEISFITETKENHCKKTADEIVNEIVASLDIVQARNASKGFNGWISSFKGFLKKIEMTGLAQAWEFLPYADKNDGLSHSLEIEEDLRLAIAQYFHHFPPLQTIDAVRILKDEINNTVDFQEICRLLKIKWVDNESVEVLFSSRRKLKEKVLLIYNATEFLMIEYLLDRVHLERPIGYSVFRITVSESVGEGDEAIEYHIRQEINKTLGAKYRSINKETDTEVIRRKLSGSEKLAICSIPRKLAKSEILKKLSEDYKDIVFLIQVKSEEEEEFLKSGARKLTPWLTDAMIHDLDALDTELNNI